ncbi:phage integrase SAM-like domain-containing protein [Tamlana sp. 2201CG12-4]|uniref:tyrosine-type recombinase/integrase n=1 Tax=Tamlana sp. 2201CG12-4 TaxID=3112582 RepID=UPI002DBA856D|nr:phage integrase SAM-like domain-containing protein [Tamlana sp. 2201CG12-4]MEC3906731.1 phage integrase SAM-like domain-containing protein [Tamlana sp. 2201CG12-4]
MATINYRLHGKNNPTSVYLRFKQGGKFDHEAPLDLYVDRKHWSTTKQRVRNLAEAEYRNKVNNALNKLKPFIIERYTLDNSNGVPISKKWLKTIINNYFNRNTDTNNDSKYFLTSFIKFFIEKSLLRTNRKTGEPIAPRTIQHYRTTLTKINSFQEKHNLNIKLTDIDVPFHTKFTEYLRDTHKLNPNTIGGYIDDIKTFMRYAERQGFKVNQSFRDPDFFTPKNKTKDIALTEKDINKIFDKEFELDSYLDNARDWLIIGVWTGLRISDLLTLDKKKFNDGFIELTNEKTNIPVIIPILEQVEQTLNKRKGELPRKISDQNFNKYIKKVCKKAEINDLVEGGKMNKKTRRKEFGKFPKWQLVTSHTCRRTFATLHYGKIDTLTIMKITGHTTEKQFIDYIKIPSREYAIRLKEYHLKMKKIREHEATLMAV